MKKNQLKIPLIMAALALGGFAARAQSPGGVPVAAWWRPDASGTLFSDAGVTPATDSSQLYQWNDATGHGYNLTQTNAGDRPVFSNAKTLANFNPSITFASDYMEFAPAAGDSVIGRADGTLYAAGKMNVVGNTGFFGFDASNDFPGLHTYPVGSNYNLLFFANGGPGYQGLSHSSFANNATFIAGAGWVNDGGSAAGYLGATVSLNGDTAVYSGTQMLNVNANAAYGEVRIGWDNNWGALNGELNELMVFENKLTYAQMQQVESYLAIKYGTTLDSGNVNYVSSSGSTVWSAAANAGNNHNIAGIARDDNGSLYQKQSWSSNAGNQVLISTTGLANTNAANTGTLTDGQFLVWGDNGMAKYPSVAVSNIAGANYRFAAVWKAQNTGPVGTVRVAWPARYAAIKLVQSSDSTFASGNTITDMTANTQDVNGVMYNYADVTLEDGQYFTFAILAQSPGGIATLPAVWYRPDMVSNSKWQDASVNSLDLTTQDTSATYSVDVNDGNQVHNFHKWTNGYTNTKYFSNREASSPLFGTWGDNGVTTTASTDYAGGYYYMPLTVFGVARDTVAANSTGAITGIDNDQGYGAEPGFGIYGGKQSFYRYGNGADVRNNAAAIVAPVNASAVYSWRPPAGGSAASGNDTLLMGTNGAYSKILINRKSSVAGPHINIGTDNFAHPSGFDGSIQEVIWYKDSLSSSDMQKVETYLALKYGTTLAHDYVNAAGDTVYKVSDADSNYRYNIGGIGHEAANGGLDQRQSNSVNTGSQVLISTTGLANTNDSNATALTDGQFLVWGDNGLGKQPAVAITNVPGTNFRFAAVWKAHNIGAVGTVRVAWPATWAALKLVQNSDSTFASGNTVTDMTANTQTINGVTYNYADVTLADGQYFTFAAFVQAPGGVADGLLMWHRADDGTATAGAKNIWQDVSGNGRDVTQNNDTAYQPKLYTEAIDSANGKAFFFNYNPFYYFDGTNDFFYRLNDDYFPADTSAGTTYGVMFNTANGGWNTPYGWGDDDPNLVRAGDNYQLWRDNGAAIDQNIGASSLPAMIGGMGWKGSGTANNGMYLNVNGKVYSTPSYNIGTIDNNDHNFAIGSEGFALTGAGNEHFQGGIAEVFVYSKDYQNDTTDAKQRINSYLAIKYGITLSNDSGNAVPDYLSSTSQVVWDATANAGYNNNIAGIAYDYNSGLQQKQSVSENSGKQVLIGTTGLDNTNAANATALTTDGQFLVWGDNGLAKSPSVYLGSTFSTVNVRFSAVWKVANTGSVGTVRVAWPAGLNDLSLIQSADTTFDASDIVTGMAANTQDINGVTYNYADVTLANGEYFTFATKIEHAPGGVFAGLSYWYRADKDAVNTGDSTDVTSWTDYATGTVVGQVGTNSYPLYHEGNAAYLNFNPGINFTDGNQSLGNLSAQTVSDTAYDIFTLTKEGITAGGANARVFSVLSSRSNPTGSIHYWDGIGLNYDSRVERYNTSSGLSYLGNPGNVNFAGNSPSIMAYTFTDHTVIKGLNGAAAGNPANSGPYGIIDGGFIFGSTVFSGNGSDNYSLKGSIGETIVYGSRNLSPVERDKVNSYLAIKYGVTMDTVSSYITADSTIVWDKDADRDFYHNIAGIGRDDISSLYQKQSRSQVTNNPNDEVIMGLDSIYVTNLDNTDSVNDGQFLVWGDNGNTQAMTNTASTYATFTYNGNSDNRRMKRVWKVRNTDVANQVAIRFPQASVGTTTIPGETASAGYAIIFASDSAFTNGLTVRLLTAGGNNYDVATTFPDGVSYFTFGKIMDTTLPPAACTPDIYLAQDNPTTLRTVDVSANPFTYNVVGGCHRGRCLQCHRCKSQRWLYLWNA